MTAHAFKLTVSEKAWSKLCNSAMASPVKVTMLSCIESMCCRRSCSIKFRNATCCRHRETVSSAMFSAAATSLPCLPLTNKPAAITCRGRRSRTTTAVDARVVSAGVGSGSRSDSSSHASDAVGRSAPIRVGFGQGCLVLAPSLRLEGREMALAGIFLRRVGGVSSRRSPQFADICTLIAFDTAPPPTADGSAAITG